MNDIKVGSLTLRFVQTKHDTGGVLDMFEMTVPPDARMPVAHRHRDWEETVFGLTGTTTWTVEGRAHAVGPGRSLFIPRDTVHGFDNRSGSTASCLCVLTPGVLGPEYFQEMESALSRSPPAGPEELKAVMLRHGLIPAPG